LNLIFLIYLFRDTNVGRIFYKSNQTCGTYTIDDKYLGTEVVYRLAMLSVLPIQGRYEGTYSASMIKAVFGGALAERFRLCLSCPRGHATVLPSVTLCVLLCRLRLNVASKGSRRSHGFGALTAPPQYCYGGRSRRSPPNGP
jgi:hypothetical protein